MRQVLALVLISSSVFFIACSHGELVPLKSSLLELLFVLFLICCIPLTLLLLLGP